MKNTMKVEMWPIDRVKPYEKNPRVNEQAVPSVAASLKAFGFRQPLVVGVHGTLIVGHTRWKAAKSLGMTHVPVHVATDLSEQQIRAYRIADNKLGELAEWDPQLLTEELEFLKLDGFDLDLTGFSLGDLERMAESKVAEDVVPPVQKKTTTKRGDIFILGKHRLLCGDSAKAEDVDKLMNGCRKATMCFTDPPWNVGIGKDGNPRHKQRDEGLQNDDMTSAEFADFLVGFMNNMTKVVTGDLYAVLGAAEWPTLDACLRTEGYHWSATVIWVKDIFVLGRSKYHRRYEPIWYGWHKNAKSSFCGARDLDDVWEIPRPRNSEEHPTMKPVKLVEQAIVNSSKPGDVVYEPFAGSGTDFIAAEQLERVCFGIEISPHYCDVIVSRWEALTGKKAKKTPQ